jgi:hypothetical protein
MMASLPEGDPPKLVMTVLPRLQDQNDQIIAMLREQNELLRQATARGVTANWPRVTVSRDGLMSGSDSQIRNSPASLIATCSNARRLATTSIPFLRCGRRYTRWRCYFRK